MPYLHAPAKNRLTILARANGHDTTIALPRSDRVVGTCSSPATSISLPHMRDVPCEESRWPTRSQRDDRVGRTAVVHDRLAGAAASMTNRASRSPSPT